MQSTLRFRAKRRLAFVKNGYKPLNDFEQAELVYRLYDRVDIEAVVRNLVKNEVTDRIFGFVGSRTRLLDGRSAEASRFNRAPDLRPDAASAARAKASAARQAISGDRQALRQASLASFRRLAG